MKRFIYILTTSLSMAILLLSIPSCIDDECAECNATNKDLTIELSFTKSGSQDAQTRATDEEYGDADGSFNEEKIETLDVFFYQDGTLKWKVSSSNLTYNQSTNIAILPIPVDKEALFRNNTTISYNVYVVANNTVDLSSITEGGNNLQTLRDLVFETPDFVTKGGATPQANFVMDGSISKIINNNSPDIGKIYMKRAASKIRLRVVEVTIPDCVLCADHVENDIKARLVHFSTKSSLMQGGNVPTLTTDDWKSTNPKVVATTVPEALGGGTTTVAPFYAYPNNWQDDLNKETYIELYVPMQLDGQEEVVNYKYLIPVTPQNLTGEDAQYMNRLDRNFIYDIAVTIRILGSIEEPPVVIEGNYIIKDWATQEVLVDIKGAHYLVVSERNVVMPNITGYTLNYNSSVANVTLVPNSLKATYTYVPAGASAPVTTNVASSQMPTVTVQPNAASGTIVINSPIPVNYIPKDIEFKVTNGSFTETVTVTQKPATYFTTTKGVRSSMRTSLAPDGLTNPYMYGITTLAPDGNTIWGFPPTDNQGQTVNSEEVSKMISPKFEMASQFGASTTKSYSNAQAQCRDYWEDPENGPRKTGWRLPTAAEIHFIDNLQQVAPSGAVMTGLYYWSSWSQYPSSSTNRGAYRMGVNLYNTQTYFGYSDGSYNNAYTRCIRDIKD